MTTIATIFGISTCGCTCADAHRLEGDRENTSFEDRGRPEAQLVLWRAMQSMEEYHLQHGRYADKWTLLDIQFAWPFWHKGDADVRPRPGTGAVWQPKGCHSTYVIRSATASTVLIQSVNPQGELEYEIEQGMVDPRKIGTGK